MAVIACPNDDVFDGITKALTVGPSVVASTRL
jgi:hypothetical protein